MENGISLTLLASSVLLYPFCPLFSYPDLTDICISSCWTNATASRCAALKHVFSSPRGGITLIGRLRPMYARTHPQKQYTLHTHILVYLFLRCYMFYRFRRWKGEHEFKFISRDFSQGTTELSFLKESGKIRPSASKNIKFKPLTYTDIIVNLLLL